MKISSFTKPELSGSFVYFIFAKDLLYIGETQKITFSRWVQHFQKSGTFSMKVRAINPNVNYNKDANLLSIELIEIRSRFPELRWKTITQAVEHSIHEILYKSQKDLLSSYYEKYQPEVDHFFIISDTTRTAPTKIPKNEWDFARNYANEVLQGIYEFL